ncbi:hypothetical protein DVH24_011676 [Malus domestica]|uniref:Gnk2-homologous domain-containing protein n=1 Tax=Malus domestica TaxID=3750 RepID=A0A498K1W7_MALDO|nr:hypothetical protein DVH24_011676 [Malus domestica]
MDKDKLLVMLFAIILLLMPVALSATDPLSIFCSADGRSSQFESNLERLLRGFYNDTIGDGRDIVPGQALCRWDVNSIVCRNCFMKQARKSSRVAKQLMQCLVQAMPSSISIPDVLSTNRKYLDKDSQEKNVSMTNPHHFNDVYIGLFDVKCSRV